MTETTLFTSSAGAITTESLLRDLHAVRAAECDVLFLHTGLNLGTPNPALGRRGLLEQLWAVVLRLGVGTVCLPTFTFSFCNGQDFDVDASPSRMGALNEYVRRLPEATRSVDPLMSVALVGSERSLVTDIGHSSIGPRSTYDLLHRRGGVRFAFLGVRCYECFTYTHYVEACIPVPYRYNRTFTGRITAGGRTYDDAFELFVRYKGVTPTSEDGFERHLESTGLLAKRPLGAGWLSAVDEASAYQAMLDCYAADPGCLIAEPFDASRLDTTFEARDMVAL